MAILIRHLFELPEHVPTVARWIYEEFWVGKGKLTADAIAQLLGRAVREDLIPLSLLALKSGEPVGTVNLIENDDEIHEGAPDDTFDYFRSWLYRPGS
jgi:hypothetical protein